MNEKAFTNEEILKNAEWRASVDEIEARYAAEQAAKRPIKDGLRIAYRKIREAEKACSSASHTVNGLRMRPLEQSADEIHLTRVALMDALMALDDAEGALHAYLADVSKLYGTWPGEADDGFEDTIDNARRLTRSDRPPGGTGPEASADNPFIEALVDYFEKFMDALDGIVDAPIDETPAALKVALDAGAKANMLGSMLEIAVKSKRRRQPSPTSETEPKP